MHNLCSSFPLGITVVPREIENNAYKIFWDANNMHYGRCASGVSTNFTLLKNLQEVLAWVLLKTCKQIGQRYLCILCNFKSTWNKIKRDKRKDILTTASQTYIFLQLLFSTWKKIWSFQEVQRNIEVLPYGTVCQIVWRKLSHCSCLKGNEMFCSTEIYLLYVVEHK